MSHVTRDGLNYYIQYGLFVAPAHNLLTEQQHPPWHQTMESQTVKLVKPSSNMLRQVMLRFIKHPIRR